LGILAHPEALGPQLGCQEGSASVKEDVRWHWAVVRSGLGCSWGRVRRG
jgi:hypothetical protein